MNDYVAPDHDKNAYNCPHCGALSNHEKFQLSWYQQGSDKGIYVNNKFGDDERFTIDQCQNPECTRITIWRNVVVRDGDKQYRDWRMIYPLTVTAPLPNSDMPTDLLQIYHEARNIYDQSPRGAAALLRLLIELLMPHLAAEGHTLNNKIGDLVKKGLSKRVQKALDSVRVIGNNAVHPGEITLEDDREIALKLFSLVNIIVGRMITDERLIDEMYDIVPDGAREGVDKRDGNADQLADED